MIQFAQTTNPPKPKNSATSVVALIYAVLLIVMVVGQLFSFEKFIPMIESFGLGGGEPRATLIASGLVVAGVFALPFLLRMYVSPAMRIVSMVMGWLVAGAWLYITASITTTYNSVSNVGFTGGVLPTPLGWWSVAFAIMLVAIAAYVSWGLWPVSHARKK